MCPLWEQFLEDGKGWKEIGGKDKKTEKEGIGRRTLWKVS